PALPAFGCHELQQEGVVAVGRTATHVALRAGPWTLCLAVETAARFPDADAVIPRDDGKATRLCLSEEDARFLLHALPRLPGKGEDLAPVTLDLGDEVVLRARAEGQEQAGELVLSGSRRDGPPVRTAVNRRYLVRVAQLGFREVRVAGPSVPLVCRDATRVFVFMPLDGDAVVPPGGHALRVCSANGAVPGPPAPLPEPEPEPEKERRVVIVPRPEESPNGQPGNGHADAAGLD